MNGIGGTLVNYYVHCKRQCWLAAKGLGQEKNSELVKIGRFFHHEFLENDKEDFINGIKVDKIQGDYVIEYKKSNADEKAAKWQLLFYLWKLKQIGIVRKGILKFKENRDNKEVVLTKEREKELRKITEEIKILLQQKIPPPVLAQRRCRRCAYFEFCYS